MAGRAVWNEASEQRYIKFWAPLKTHLNGEFQGDIFRFLYNQLYCMNLQTTQLICKCLF